MFNPTTTLIATLLALPAIFAQGTNNTFVAAANSTTATASSNSNPQSSDSTAASGASFTPTNFTPSVVSGTTCGSAQQNLNQCIIKVGKDISSCTDNTCMCQTYANIAACYNGCPELVDQGKQYQLQSGQYCTIAGVKPNTTATPTPPTVSPPITSTTSITTPVRTNNTSIPSSNASTFSAAKGSAAATEAQVSTAGFLVALASGIMATCL